MKGHTEEAKAAEIFSISSIFLVFFLLLLVASIFYFFFACCKLNITSFLDTDSLEIANEKIRAAIFVIVVAAACVGGCHLHTAERNAMQQLTVKCFVIDRSAAASDARKIISNISHSVHKLNQFT